MIFRLFGFFFIYINWSQYEQIQKETKKKKETIKSMVYWCIPSEKVAEEGRGGEGEKHESREVYE